MPTIVSGGQTGVDRAALDAALALGLSVGGWCPRGRRAEDGRIADRYPLIETPLARPIQRTRWNVRDSDATLAIVDGRPRGGTLMTLRAAAGRRPLLVLRPEARAARARAFLARHRVRRLNVAGPRASEAADIYRRARRFLAPIFAAWSGRRGRYLQEDGG
jgi:hypothetical protein